ncbi:hypothetical protein AXG93_2752s1730 [Marchantia polymorpha subsp. ruderalis]|uniref:PAR1 protein n=2 Tax=Marchantia polymorpha TaxID=3197 RepID=A0A176VTL3_MARPO|nr:hypothetical protein AXG93_2752s1730 [Marchantia polymorpha subsp. ruderalis]
MTTQRRGVFLSVLLYVVSLNIVEGISFIRFDCELLPKEECAFAIGQRGFRCLLETSIGLDGLIIHHCQTSDIEWTTDADDLRRELRSIRSGGHIESDECLEACGLDRLTVGISTDGLQTGAFKEKICSEDCRHNCPQVISLYNIIYAEEGEELGQVCEELYQWKHSERLRARKLVRSFAPSIEKVAAPAPAPSGAES